MSSTTLVEMPFGTIRAARWAVLTIFFLNGFIIASWVTHIPFVRQRFALSDGALGLVLLAVAVGAVVSLLAAGGLIARFGSRWVVRVTTVAFCVILPLLLFAPNVPLLVAALVLFGMCNGALDVAMNAQASAVEERYQRPIMSTFHGMFSLGGLIGALIGSATLAVGMHPTAHVLSVALVLLVIGVAALRWLLPSSIDQVSAQPAFALPSGPLFLLGLLAFCGLVAEGAMADWTAVYLHSSLGTDTSFAAAGYAAFSLAMAVGRFTGDGLRARFSAAMLVRLSGVVTAVGLGIALLVGQPLVALVGFGCVGLGMANIVPVLFSAAARTPGVPTGTAIAAVAFAGYFGFLAGPPIIGFIAQATSLTVGLGVVVVFAALIAMGAGVAAQADQ